MYTKKIMHAQAQDIASMTKRYRGNFINSVSGVKSANLVGTTQPDGRYNLALFSSAVHLGADPPLMGLVSRPHTVKRDTLAAIQASEYYTVNHVNQAIYKQAHQTSARTNRSEFDITGLTPEIIGSFSAPFVQESKLKLGLKLVRLIPLAENNTVFIIGVIQHVIVPTGAILDTGDINIAALDTVGVTGLGTYTKLTPLETLPYVHAID